MEADKPRRFQHYLSNKINPRPAKRDKGKGLGSQRKHRRAGFQVKTTLMNLFGFCVFLIRAYPNLPTSRKRLPGWFFFSVSLPTPFDQGPAHLLTVLFPRPPLSSPPRSLLHHPTLETSTVSFSSEPLWSLWRGEYSRYRFLSSQQELKGAGKKGFQKYGEGVKRPQRTPLPHVQPRTTLTSEVHESRKSPGKGQRSSLP